MEVEQSWNPGVPPVDDRRPPASMHAWLRVGAILLSVVKGVPLLALVGWFAFTSATVTFAGADCAAPALDDDLCSEGMGLWILFFLAIAAVTVLALPLLIGQLVSARSQRIGRLAAFSSLLTLADLAVVGLYWRAGPGSDHPTAEITSGFLAVLAVAIAQLVITVGAVMAERR